MATSPAPHAHKVRVREISTGRVFDAWPVDAREMVSHAKGGYEYAPGADLGLPGDVPAEEKPPISLHALLEEKSRKELQSLARRAGMNDKQKDAELIAALIPHIEAGTVSLAELPALTLPNAQFPNATAAE